MRRESDERRPGADRRGDRDDADREVNGGERRDLLLDLRLAPAQRRRGDRDPARSQGEPAAAARRRGRDERVFPRPPAATRVRAASGGPHPGAGNRDRCRRRG